MMAQTLPSIRASADDPSSIARNERGRQGFLKLNMQLDFVNRSPSSQPFSVVAKSFGPVGIGRVLGTVATFTRARRHFADNRDLLSLVISRGVAFRLDDARSSERYGRHGAALLESRSESGLHSLTEGAAWTICMERAPLQPLLAGIDGPLQRCIKPGNAALRLLIGYVETLFALEQECDPALVATHLTDLVVNALGVSGDAQALVRERGVQAARRQAVIDLIAECAGDPAFDPAHAADRLGMSLRYLHKLLEPSGRTFSEHLIERRLARAREMLRDQNFAHRKIGEIARDAGFSDISHFNRSFRRTFGDTPNGVRVRAARGA